jgi:hypothetical protein
MLRGWILVPILALAVAAQPASSRAPAKFRISGTVVDAIGGGVLTDIEVSIALSQAEGLQQTVTTGPDGRFEFDGLGAAKFAMTARGRGYRSQGFEEHEGFFTGIVTGPGMISEDLVFRLKPEASIAGTVSDEFNEPAPLAHVLLFRTGMRDVSQMVLFQSEVMTDDAGHFHFSHLQEGTYYVVAYGSPWYAHQEGDETEEGVRVHGTTGATDATDASAEVARSLDGQTAGHHSEFDVAFLTTYYANANDVGQATPIMVKPGERATADFHLYAVPAVRLKVHGSAAFAKNPGTVTLVEPIFNHSRQVAVQSATENGAVLSGFAPGHYILQVPTSGNSEAVRQQPLDIAGDMEVSAGAMGKLTSSVTGMLQADDGDVPCLRCFVRLTNTVSGEDFGAQIAGKNFEIDGGVRAGRYLIWLFNAEGYEVRTMVAAGARVTGTQVDIPAGAVVRMTIVMTKALGTIDGIALRDGKPVSQTAVVLLPNDPAHNLVLMRRDQSDSDGTFTLRHVVAGNYTVIAVADGWDLDWKDANVVKAYAGGGEKIYIQPQGGQYQVKVAVQAKRN